MSKGIVAESMNSVANMSQTLNAIKKYLSSLVPLWVSTGPVRVDECSRVVFFFCVHYVAMFTVPMIWKHFTVFSSVFFTSIHFITSRDCVQVNAQKKDVRNLREIKTMDHGKCWNWTLVKKQNAKYWNSFIGCMGSSHFHEEEKTEQTNITIRLR